MAKTFNNYITQQQADELIADKVDEAIANLRQDLFDFVEQEVERRTPHEDAEDAADQVREDLRSGLYDLIDRL